MVQFFNIDTFEKYLEAHLSNYSYIHALTFKTDLEMNLKDVSMVLSFGELEMFDELILDNGVNLKYSVFLEKYEYYFIKYQAPMNI